MHVHNHRSTYGYIFQHTFLFSLSLPENAAERQGIAKGQSLADFRQTVLTLRDRFLPFHNGAKVYEDNIDG